MAGGTPFPALIAAARFHMQAATGTYGQSGYASDPYWSDDELFSILKRGCTDLWGAIIDLHEEHYLQIVEYAADGVTPIVTLASGATQLSGVPNDCFRVYLIEPIDLTTNRIAFVPRAYNHVEFQNARNQSASQTFLPTSNLNVFYDVTGIGTPQGAPVIKTAPRLSSSVSLRFVYVPTLGVESYKLETAANPIPGESDNALIAWIVAYARAKERDDRMPDPSWLAVYQTEKQAILTRLKPRQEQEAQYADGLFDNYWR